MKTVAIIGCGIVGLFTAIELAKKGFKIDIYEKNKECFQEQSRYNSAILHPNFEFDNSYLKSKLLSRGKEIYKELFSKTEIIKEIPAYMLAKSSQVEKMHYYEKQSINNNQNVLELTNEEIKKMFPNLDSKYNIGLKFNDTYILNITLLKDFLLSEIKKNEVYIFYKCEVIDIDIMNTVIITESNKKRYNYIINACGNNSLKFFIKKNNHALYNKFIKGSYLVIKKNDYDFNDRIIYPLPENNSKGILHLPFGNHLLIGPTSLEFSKIEDIDKQVTQKEFQFLLEKSKELFPNYKYEIIETFYGIRAGINFHDFIIESDISNSNIIHLLGIVSPGLTSAPAISEFIIQNYIQKN